MQSVLGKFIAVIVAAIGLMYGYKLYQDNQQDKQQLNAEISELKEMVAAQEAQRANQQDEVLTAVLAQKQDVLNAVEEQKAEAQQQLEESQKQTEILEQQIDQMTEVVDQMEEERERVEAREAEMEQLSQDSLRATYLSTGLQAAASFKVQIAEYYMMNNRFPNSNESLNLPSPRQFKTDIIRSITVSQGGKITVVYTEKSGQDKGAITLKPSVKHDQINWSCQTRDYANIQNFMPTCQYKG